MDFIEKHKKAIFFVLALFAIAAIIFTLNYRKPTFIENLVGYIVAPTQQVTDNVGDWFKEKINFISNLNDLEAENLRLQAELEELKIEAKRAEMLDIENESLRILYDLDQKYPNLPKIGAEIIAKDSNNWNTKFNINVGTNNGIEENMVVLANGGLVGKVTKAGKNYSQVTPINDDTSSVGAISKRTGDFGFVKGDLTLSDLGYCRMDSIDLDAEILENDEIVTSNLGNIYPPGITIGYVREVHVESSGLTKYAIIQPAVDFKHLETVLVVSKSHVINYIDNEQPEDSTSAIDTDTAAGGDDDLMN